MKKNTLIQSIAIVGAFMFASPLFAATTAVLSPATISVIPGQKFNVVITVNPSGTNNYAEKIELNYPKEVLEVNSFTFANTWIPLTQSGYDSNTDGVLIKTAGYPAGINGATVFGTVSFTAKKAGTGTIKIGANSLAFEASSQTAITGAGATLTIKAPVAVVKKEEKKEEVKIPKNEEKKVVSETPKESEQANSEQNQDQNLAAIAGAVPVTEKSNTLPLTALIIVAIGVIGAVYYFFYRKGKKM